MTMSTMLHVTAGHVSQYVKLSQLTLDLALFRSESFIAESEE